MSADRNPPLPRARQAVILVGGKGTRLGELARSTPKPLMLIDDHRVFLDFLIENLVRQGFDRILLLAGHYGDQIQSRYERCQILGASVTVAIEPAPMGTAGTLRLSRNLLEERFLLLNGDTYFDIAYRALGKALDAAPRSLVVIALRAIDDAARHGAVDTEGERILRFREKASTAASAAGLINVGVYLMRRDIVDLIPEGPASLEADIFPRLATQNQLCNAPREGYFIDIGLPEILTHARVELPSVVRRPALFLDRDGVINADHGYVHRWSEFDRLTSVAETIAAFNDAGWFVFVVTNQAGVAHGYYDEASVQFLHEQIRDWLAPHGAHIDMFYYCPYHPKAKHVPYRADHPDRKPNGGMLVRALEEWCVDHSRSILIGDRPSDIAAAQSIGIEGYLFAGARLDDYVRGLGFFPQVANKE